MSAINSTATDPTVYHLDNKDLSIEDTNKEGTDAIIYIGTGDDADIDIKKGATADIYVLDQEAASEINVKDGATANVHVLEDVGFNSDDRTALAGLTRETFAETGTLTREALAESANLTEDQSHALMALFDKDGDGELNQEEIGQMKDVLATVMSNVGDDDEVTVGELNALVNGGGEEEPVDLSNEALADLAIEKHEGTGIDRDPYNNDKQVGKIELANTSGITEDESKFLRSLGDGNGFISKDELVFALDNGLIQVDQETGKISLTEKGKEDAANGVSYKNEDLVNAAIAKHDGTGVNKDPFKADGQIGIHELANTSGLTGKESAYIRRLSGDGDHRFVSKDDLTAGLNEGLIKIDVDGKISLTEKGKAEAANFGKAPVEGGDDVEGGNDVEGGDDVEGGNGGASLDPSLSALQANFKTHDTDSSGFLSKTELQAVVDAGGPDAKAAQALLDNFNGAIFGVIESKNEAWAGISTADLGVLQAAVDSGSSSSLTDAIWDTATKVAIDRSITTADAPLDDQKAAINKSVEAVQTLKGVQEADEVIIDA